MIIITNEKQREVIITKEKIKKDVNVFFMICIMLGMILITNDNMPIRASLMLITIILCLCTIIIKKIIVDYFLTESEIILKEDLLIE